MTIVATRDALAYSTAVDTDCNCPAHDLTDHARHPRILVVEDEPLVAGAIAELLLDAGFEITGVVGTIEMALVLIDTGALDAASLDANLAGISAVPIAMALEARGLPYVVLSAVSFEQQPAGLRRALFLRKPCRPAQLIRVLTDLCAKH